ncbi:unnamed protein product [Boreogadus saida]
MGWPRLSTRRHRDEGCQPGCVWMNTRETCCSAAHMKLRGVAHWRRVDLDGRVLPEEEEEVVVSVHIGTSASAGYERHKKSVRHGGVGGALREGEMGPLREAGVTGRVKHKTGIKSGHAPRCSAAGCYHYHPNVIIPLRYMPTAPSVNGSSEPSEPELSEPESRHSA